MEINTMDTTTTENTNNTVSVADAINESLRNDLVEMVQEQGTKEGASARIGNAQDHFLNDLQEAERNGILLVQAKRAYSEYFGFAHQRYNPAKDKMDTIPVDMQLFNERAVPAFGSKALHKTVKVKGVETLKLRTDGPAIPNQRFSNTMSASAANNGSLLSFDSFKQLRDSLKTADKYEALKAKFKTVLDTLDNATESTIADIDVELDAIIAAIK
jgi:hypothetical protein